MPINYDQAWREAVASVDSTVQFIDTITLAHSTFPSTYRYARSDTDLLVGTDIYLGKQFAFTLPEVKSGVGGGLSIRVSNVTPDVMQIMRKAVASTEFIQLGFKSFLAGNESANASFSTTFSVSKIDFKGDDMDILASYLDTVNKKVPAEVYTTREFPGLRT